MSEINNQFNSNFTPTPPSSGSGKRVYFIIVAVVLVLIIAAALYVQNRKQKGNNPTGQAGKNQQTSQVPKGSVGTVFLDTDKGYPLNARVDLYNSIPDGFPKNLWITSDPPVHVDTFTNGNNQVQLTLVYTSSSSIDSIINQEQGVLKQAGWNVTQQTASAKLGLIVAAKTPDNLTVTVTPMAGGSNRATMQYIKNPQ